VNVSDRTEYSTSVHQLATAFTPLTASQEEYASSDDIRQNLLNLLRPSVPQSRYVQLADSRPFDSTGVEVCHDSDCPRAPIDVAQQLVGDNPDATVDELVAALQLTDEDVNCLCAATVQQSLCDTWFKQKQGRVTASDFGQIASKMKTLQMKQVSTDKLVGKIMGYTKSPNTAALKHGRTIEGLYETHEKTAKHDQFTTRNTGLSIIPHLPFVGASPDLIVQCS